MASGSLLENTKYEDLCRLCATKTELVLSVHIFEGEGPVRQICKKIDNCLQLQIHQQDELPKLICEDCLIKLEMFWDFKDRSFRTEQFLIELYKQFKEDPTSTTAAQDCVVSLDPNGLLLQVPHTHILPETLQDMSNIDISELGNRDTAENYSIILPNHTLENLELSNHDLPDQNLSNQSIHGNQDNLVVISSAQHDQRFSEDNLTLMQQQLLSDPQFQLHHELQASISGTTGIYTDTLKTSYETNRSETQRLESIEYSNSRNSLPVDSSLSDSSLGVDVDRHLNRIISYSSDSQIDSLHHHDESNSNTNILDQEMHTVNVVMEKDDFLLSNAVLDGSNHHEGLPPLPTNFYTCGLCGKTSEDRTVLEKHCQSHFLRYDDMEQELNFETPKRGSDEIVNNINESLLQNHKEDISLDSFDNYKNEDSNSLDNPATPKESPETDLSDDELPKNYIIKNASKIHDDTDQSEDKLQKEDSKTGAKVCPECGKTYKTNYKLAEHMRKHTGERPFKCRSCEKAFRSKIGLAQHEAKHTGQYDFSCPICGKGFQCKSYLMVHQRVHSDEKPYPCTTCGQNFKTKQSLLDHTNRHLGVKPYICDTCGRGFITKGLCRAHERTHAGVDNRKYSCKVCHKRFVSKSYLQTHLKIHTGEKPYMCEVCGKGFLTRVDLKIHSTLHTGEKSWVCEMCGKAFARRDALKCHRRSHTGERPYGCDICGKTFTQFTPMANHRRHHTGERPYPCETCGKTFITRSTMLAHAKKHKKTEDKKKLAKKQASPSEPSLENLEIIEDALEAPV